MAARKISNRKLSTDLHRKLSAISTCSNVSDVSNLSFKLGMDPDDFKSTVQSILELDTGADWEVDSDDEGMSCYGEENYPSLDFPKEVNRRKDSEIVKIAGGPRKSSTGSTASTDSLDEAEAFEPVEIDLSSLKSVINMYHKHRKISQSKLMQPPPIDGVKK